MKKKYFVLTLILVIASMLFGCMNQYRRTVPQNPNQTQQGQQQIQQQGQQNQNDMSPSNISATYEKADVTYARLTQNATARAGIYAGAPAVYSLTSGTTVKVLAKYDGYYVAYLPNNRLGFIPIASTTPAAVGPTGTPPTRTGTPGAGSAGGGPAAAPDIPSTPGASGSSVANEESSMIDLVNQARGQAGLKPLSSNMELTKLARLKASDISTKNYFSHTSPTYGSPFDMMKTYGVSYLYAGENLAKNANVQAAHQALMNSPGHKANILGQNFTDVGIGVIQGQGTKVYVQMFIGK